MMTIYLAPLVALVGAVIFSTTKSGELKELGRAGWWVGLLVTLLQFSSGRVLHW